MKQHLRSQKGLTLVATVFILVIVASALALMQKMVAAQIATLADAVRSANADLAMRSGLEWATYRVTNDDACPGGGSTSFTLNGYSIGITCSLDTETEEGEAVRLFSIAATASRGSFGDLGYVYRQGQVVVEK